MLPSMARSSAPFSHGAPNLEHHQRYRASCTCHVCIHTSAQSDGGGKGVRARNVRMGDRRPRTRRLRRTASMPADLAVLPCGEASLAALLPGEPGKPELLVDLHIICSSLPHPHHLPSHCQEVLGGQRREKSASSATNTTRIERPQRPAATPFPHIRTPRSLRHTHPILNSYLSEVHEYTPPPRTPGCANTGCSANSHPRCWPPSQPI